VSIMVVIINKTGKKSLTSVVLENESDNISVVNDWETLSGKEISMDILMVVGALLTLIFAAILVFGKADLDENYRVVRVPVSIESSRPGTRSKM